MGCTEIPSPVRFIALFNLVLSVILLVRLMWLTSLTCVGVVESSFALLELPEGGVLFALSAGASTGGESKSFTIHLTTCAWLEERCACNVALRSLGITSPACRSSCETRACSSVGEEQSDLRPCLYETVRGPQQEPTWKCTLAEVRLFLQRDCVNSDRNRLAV